MPKTPPNVFDYHDAMIAAHAVLGSAAALLTAPAAILIGRYFRSRSWWFKVHVTLQTFTAIFVITGTILSLVAVNANGNGTQLTGRLKDPHHDFGLSILILFLLQFVIGVGAHYTHSAAPAKGSVFPTLTTPKSPLRHVHVVFGVIMTALMYAGVKTGMDEWDNVADNGTLVPKGIRIAYWVLFGLAVAAYLFGWILEPIRGGSERNSVADAGSMEKVQE
ncbi:CBD9-like protein [Mycena venus]|uniref:CBD9-like protein n=1 Tax=Mycena venus TaxID=2733690 RepID=A0A8H7CTU0_9AGAR|nr:CBD9-like protein [Mycena venus]